ncbi:hypothetical protein [[Mycobacterium] wendilense]|uniref:Secreted protein n=1 Tax=[Mycobacterium] wendilense TaxID=3064284 RepID=A0ABM9MBP1_9MYCO|nr:hypothetical protein [Mycolicibacterium sp. MU0050]CAJ1581280.1 hypothetical protein MU0050_001478 [Mycolicibacterium sp. MU0050]
MSAFKASATAAAVAALVATGVGAPAVADATPNWGINGTFETSSNGEWAKVNDRYEKQPSTRSTWTISTVCTTPVDCAGTVNSDQGWTAPIYTKSGVWYVKRAWPEWRWCADGQPIEGLQTYLLYPVGADGRVDVKSNEYAGEDVTTGPSGSCGRNQWPHIRMPFFMRKI